MGILISRYSFARSHTHESKMRSLRRWCYLTPRDRSHRLGRMRNERGDWSARGSANFSPSIRRSLPSFLRLLLRSVVHTIRCISVRLAAPLRAETHHPSSRVSPETFQVYYGVNKTPAKRSFAHRAPPKAACNHATIFARALTVYLQRERPSRGNSPSA